MKLIKSKFQSPTNIRAFYQATGDLQQQETENQDILNETQMKGKLLYKCKQLSNQRKELLKISKVKNTISSGTKNKDWRLTNLTLKNDRILHFYKFQNSNLENSFSSPDDAFKKLAFRNSFRFKSPSPLKEKDLKRNNFTPEKIEQIHHLNNLEPEQAAREKIEHENHLLFHFLNSEPEKT